MNWQSKFIWSQQCPDNDKKLHETLNKLFLYFIAWFIRAFYTDLTIKSVFLYLERIDLEGGMT